MTKASTIDDVRKAFADITATLEDLTILASEGQSASDIAAARQLTGQLIRRFKYSLASADRLRRRLG